MRAPRNPAGRATALASMLGAALAAGACEFGTTAIAPPVAKVVVHAVLNPAHGEQMVLVERTLTGRVQLEPSRFDPENPIVTGGGVPVSGAEVVLESEQGMRWLASEFPVRSGVYTFLITAANALVPGQGYTLHVRTPEGEVVRGATRLPNALPASRAPVRLFNRDADTLRLEWPKIEGARSYALRVDTPTGPFFFFSDSSVLVLPGSLRNLFARGLPRVFIPGFRQIVTVSAVDVNYFDYYRSRNDVFSGSGLINRLEGGIGLFGAAVNVVVQVLDVAADYRTYPEGVYMRGRGAGPQLLNLYLESPATATRAAIVTGRYILNIGSDPQGFLGTYDGTTLSLAMLSGQLVSDTAITFRGRAMGDSIVGQFGFNDTTVYHRRQ